jgi:hypothetical protein
VRDRSASRQEQDRLYIGEHHVGPTKGMTR